MRGEPKQVVLLGIRGTWRLPSSVRQLTRSDQEQGRCPPACWVVSYHLLPRLDGCVDNAHMTYIEKFQGNMTDYHHSDHSDYAGSTLGGRAEDNRAEINRARQAAEALFEPKPRMTASPDPTAGPSADQTARKPRVLSAVQVRPTRIEPTKTPVVPYSARAEQGNPSVASRSPPNLAQVRYDDPASCEGLRGHDRRHRAHLARRLTDSGRN